MNRLVLIIEDDAIVRQTIEIMLEGAGVEVMLAADGREGMRLVRTHRPVIVVTDIVMSEQEGIETILQIRGEAPETKIIAISAGGRLGNSDILEIAVKLGADFTLAKPFEGQQLIDLVQKCLEDR